MVGKENIKIISYNVLIGFNRAGKVDEVAEWLKKQAPDVVLFQELAGSDSKSFAELTRKWDHPYAEVNLPFDPYSIGISSKYPFEFIESQYSEDPNFTVGKRLYTLAKINGIYYMSLHLSPFAYHFRERQSEICVARLRPLIEAGEKVIVAGDFNNPSPYDIDRVNRNDEELKQLKHALKAGKFDATPVKNFIDSGMTEIVGATNNAGRISPRKRHRIDHFLLSNNLVESVISAHAADEDVADLSTFSDHYPMILKLKGQISGAAPEPIYSPAVAVRQYENISKLTGNLLVNGDFSQAFHRWRAEFGGGATFSMETTPEGLAILRRNGDDGWGSVCAIAEINPNEYYTVKIRRRSDIYYQDHLEIAFKNSSGEWIDTARMEFYDPLYANRWQEAVFTFKSPEEATRIWIREWLDFEGKLEFDYLLLLPATSSEIATLDEPEHKTADFNSSAAWRESKQGFSYRDFDVEADQNRRFLLQWDEESGESAQVSLCFRRRDDRWAQGARLTFFPVAKQRSIDEVLLIPSEITGVRVVASGIRKIKNITFER